MCAADKSLLWCDTGSHVFGSSSAPAPTILLHWTIWLFSAVGFSSSLPSPHSRNYFLPSKPQKSTVWIHCNATHSTHLWYSFQGSLKAEAWWFHIHLPSSLLLVQVKTGHCTKNCFQDLHTLGWWDSPVGKTPVAQTWLTSLIPRPTWWKETTTPLRSIHELRHIHTNMCTHTQYRNT